MIIDPKEEFIGLQGEEYRDLWHIVEVASRGIDTQHIVKYFHKSSMKFMAEVCEQIRRAEGLEVEE